MKKKIAILTTCAAVLTGSLLAGTMAAQAAPAYCGSHYGTGFDDYDGSALELSNWSNGDMFNCTWRPENVSFSNGIMSLKIDWDGKGFTGAECRTKEYFGYGMYQVSMKPIKNPGVVTSFFTYTGLSDGTKWDEIDIEFLGYDTTKVQFNYYTDGKADHEYLYDLGFDASEGFHTYGFYWAADSITWYVDGNPVFTAWENIPDTPGKIMMNVWPGIGVDDWLRPYDGKTPLYGYYDWIAYDSPR